MDLLLLLLTLKKRGENTKYNIEFPTTDSTTAGIQNLEGWNYPVGGGRHRSSTQSLISQKYPRPNPKLY
jgi:hypothetical protein